MRIVSRPDFDGIVCAVLLFEALDIQKPVFWVEPGDLQNGRIAIKAGDVIANLPYHPSCRMWFDHHISNRPDTAFDGAFAIKPSAARVIYDHFSERLHPRFDALVSAADKIDAAALNQEEVLHPERFPIVLVSMTVTGQDTEGAPYWDHLVTLLRRHAIPAVHNDPWVADRCQRATQQNEAYQKLLATHTRVDGHVSIIDFRNRTPAPIGNRFLVYCLFPETIVNVKIRRDDAQPDRLIVSVGHSIFNRQCRVNVGRLMQRFQGGGHRGAGACNFQESREKDILPEIISVLKENKDIDPVSGDTAK
ncbi:MAG: exopolyphosphatase [Pseudomonadota bacterium]